MADSPKGILTFLFSDVEDSSRLWQDSLRDMRVAVARLDAIVSAVVSAEGGVLFKPRGEGDSHFVVFSLPSAAVRAAAKLQRRLLDEHWPADLAFRVRMALHSGEADLRDGDYYGLTPNRCARLRAIAHGGQIVLSRATWELVIDVAEDGLTFSNLGIRYLRGLTRPEEVWQVCGLGLPDEFPPLGGVPGVGGSAAIMICDVVGSTQLANELGNKKYREWLDAFEKHARTQIELHAGHAWTFVDAYVMATFEAVGQAIESAMAIRYGVLELGAEAKIGIHAGEFQLRRGQPHGLAIHMASRLMQVAEANQVLVSRTVVDLLSGSEIRFVDRGRVALRGLSGEWEVYSIAE